MASMFIAPVPCGLEVVIEGPVERLAGEDDRLPRRLQARRQPARQHTGRRVALALEPHEDIAEFEAGFFQAAREAVRGSRGGECREMPAGLQAVQAGAAPLARELLKSLVRVLARSAAALPSTRGWVEAGGPVPRHAVDADAVWRVGDDRIDAVSVELWEHCEAVGLLDLPAAWGSW